MNNSWMCDDCIHKSVCIYNSTLNTLQNELYRELEHATFRDGLHACGVKLSAVDFIKTVKIECKHYERNTSILVG